MSGQNGNDARALKAQGDRQRSLGREATKANDKGGDQGPPLARARSTDRPKEHTRATVPRLALTVGEACESLGIGHDAWLDYVAPHVRMVRIGRKKIIASTELQRYLDEQAETTLGRRR